MKRRLLLVEDDEIFLRPLQRSLEVAGYEVLLASSGEQALALGRLGGDALALGGNEGHPHAHRPCLAAASLSIIAAASTSSSVV